VTRCLNHTDGWTYYVGQAHAGQDVTATIDAKARQIVVYQGNTVLKRAGIKGLVGAPLAFHDFVAHLVKETTSPLRKTAQFSASSLQRTTPLERNGPQRAGRRASDVTRSAARQNLAGRMESAGMRGGCFIAGCVSF
jgi:hypothetical protein